MAEASASSAPLLHKLAGVLDLSGEEIHCITGVHSRTRRLAKGSRLLAEGDDLAHVHIVVSGWAACYKILPNGRRSVIDFVIKGDLVGLPALLLAKSEHSVVTLTPAMVNETPSAEMLQMMRCCPRLATALLGAACRQQAIMVEHLVGIARRSALERTAHLLLELTTRMRRAGLGRPGYFVFPLIQDDLADALGLTAIHVNRVLRQLRQRGLIALSNRRLTILEPKRLAELAGFAERYLEQKPRLPEGA